MKNWMVAVMCVCFVGSAQARQWTNTEGKTLEAELVRVKGNDVFLKLENRKIVPLEISKLSEADQEYIKAYEQDEAARKKAEELADRKAKWHEDFSDAKAEAEEYNLPILLLYTAPEWCGYCVKLEDRVYDTSDFKKFANQNLVLLMADFSKSADKPKWEKRNSQISGKFKAGGYPTTFFITADAEQLGKLGGYEDKWSTDDYIKKMQAIINK